MIREEKFARILAIANRLSQRSYKGNRPTIEQRYRTQFTKNPAKILKLIHKDLMDYSINWSDKDWLLFEVLSEEVANLELDELTNEDLNEMFYIHLGKAKVEMWNVIGVEQAAEILKLSPGTVKNYCASGQIPAKKIGKQWIIDKTKLVKEEGIHERKE